jgi:hypothetical protein
MDKMIYISFVKGVDTELKKGKKYIANRSGRPIWGTGRKPIDCWNRGFESCRVHNSSSLVFVLCFVCSGLWDELITRSEDSYRLCVSKCGWSRSLTSGAVWAELGCRATKKITINFIFNYRPLKFDVHYIPPSGFRTHKGFFAVYYRCGRKQITVRQQTHVPC